MKTFRISTLNSLGEYLLEMPEYLTDKMILTNDVNDGSDTIQTLEFKLELESKTIPIKQRQTDLIYFINYNINETIYNILNCINEESRHSNYQTECLFSKIAQIAQLILLSKPILGLISIMDPVQKFNLELLYIYNKRTHNFKLPQEELSLDDDPYFWASLNNYQDNKIKMEYF